MRSYSKISLWLCGLFLCYTHFIFYPKWKQTGTEASLSWDVSGYYMYLPALFIYQDIKTCAFKDSILKTYQPSPVFNNAWVHKKTGNYVMKYACGQAVVMFPFFTIAHAWALQDDRYPADGFSFPYQFCIGVGMLLLAFLGLLVLRRIVVVYFKDGTVALVLIALVFGSNYLNYAAIDNGMNHNSLFTLYALVIYLTMKFYQKPSLPRLMVLGLLSGLMVMIRPTEIIVVVLVMGWGLTTKQDILFRFHFWLNHWRWLIGLGLSFMVVISLQLFYWHYVSGDWIVYSYQDQGFDFLKPHTLLFLFSAKCGWLRYCPMLLLTYIGCIGLFKQKTNQITLIALMILNLYIVSSWSIWDYGNSAGRAMIQSYPILAFPMCAGIEAMQRRRWLLWFLYPFLLMSIYLNLWWTYHAHRTYIRINNISEAYYWRAVGRWRIPDDYVKLLWCNDYVDQIPKQTKTIYSNHFDTDTSKNAIVIKGNPMIRVSKALDYSPLYTIPNSDRIQSYMRVYANIQTDHKEEEEGGMNQFILIFNKGGKEIKRNMIVPGLLIKGDKPQTIFMDARCPKSWDSCGIVFWNPIGDETLLIDSLTVITFDPEE